MSVINTSSNTVVATMPVGANPVDVVLNPTGSRAYVDNSADNTVSVINTATNTVVATVPVGVFPLGVAVNPAGSRLYVTNSFANSVSVIDTSTNAVVATVAVGGGHHAAWCGGQPNGRSALRCQQQQQHGLGDRHGHQHRGGNGCGGSRPDSLWSIHQRLGRPQRVSPCPPCLALGAGAALAAGGGALARSRAKG